MDTTDEKRCGSPIHGSVGGGGVAVGIVERPTHAAEPFTVNATSDEADANLTDAVCEVDVVTSGDQCTLRAALQEANDTPGADTIKFAISTSGPVKTISPASALPTITDPSP